MISVPHDITRRISEMYSREVWFNNSGTGPVSAKGIASWQAAITAADATPYVNFRVDEFNALRTREKEYYALKKKANQIAALHQALQIEVTPIAFVMVSHIVFPPDTPLRTRRVGLDQIGNLIGAFRSEMIGDPDDNFFRLTLEMYLDGYFPCGVKKVKGKNVPIVF